MAAQKRENLLVNIVCNLALPSLILTKLSGEKALGPVWGLVVALAFPVGYAVYDFSVRRRMNFISVAGFISVLLSGGLGLMQVQAKWFAVKEGAVPLAIAAGVLLSARSKTPILQELLMNEQVVDLPRIEAALSAQNAHEAFRGLIARASFWLAAGFVLSAAANYVLSRKIIHSQAGTPEFNAELGRMHLLSWPIIVIPSMAIMMLIFWQLIKGLTTLTALTTDDLFHHPSSDKQPPAK